MLRRLSNPPNPWHSTRIEWLGEPPPLKLEVFEERAYSIVTENESPDVGFRFGVNPYRGCMHGCAYCYARPYHQYLDFGAGTDFERKIVAKVNAPELLEKHFEKRSWKGDTLAFCGITDCYQPLEANYQLTRRCLEVCNRYGNPVAIITKGILIRRDVGLLSEMSARGLIGSVFFSIPFADEETARKMEPYAATPAQRFEAMALLASAGVPVGISLAPLIPGLNESHMPELLERAHEAGARSTFFTMVKLAREVLPVFEERVREAFPERAEKIFNGIKSMRDGKMNNSNFGERQRGSGVRWDTVEQVFDLHCRRLGFNQSEDLPEKRVPFRRPSPQGELFENF